MKKNETMKGKGKPGQINQPAPNQISPPQSNPQEIPQSTQDELNKELVKSTDMITSLIHEYLLKKDYNHSLDMFQEEVSYKIKNKIYYKGNFQEINEQKILKIFSSGKKSEFFKHWNRIIPSHIKSKDPQLGKLEFYLEIYFAIFPILDKKVVTKDNLRELKGNMEEFKKFLEKKEVELSKTTEFLAYYALPYVPNPKDHPSYQKLFTPEWCKDLREQIKQCIKNYLPSMKYPVLYDLVSSNEDDQSKMEAMRNFLESLSGKAERDRQSINEAVLGNPGAELQMENERLQDEIRKYKQKEEKNKMAFVDSQKTWTHLALNIINYSFDLINISKKLMGNSDNEVSAKVEKINKKLIKYQSFLKKNNDDLDKNKNNSSKLYIKSEEVDMINNSKYEDKENILNAAVNPNPNENNPVQSFSLQKEMEKDNQKEENADDSMADRKSIQIDYEPTNLIDMKKFLMALNRKIAVEDNKLMYIIREIRLRIFRRTNADLRNITLFSLFYYDIFNLASRSSQLLHNLLLNPNLNLETMKLMNYIAALARGRSYLLTKVSIIDDIVNVMKAESTDSELRQNCLGTIQKFTLRSVPQNRLIELDVIKFIVDVFTYESNTLSDYTIEYGLALIMNLSLKKSGREKFEQVSDKIFPILLNFINKDNLQIHTCINGTLYSLLKKNKFKKEAKKFNLESILSSLHSDSPVLQKQISYILEELNNEEEEDDAEENYEDDTGDTGEDEINADEYEDTDSIDENLLEEHYKALGEFIIRNTDINRIETEKIEKYINSNPNGDNIHKSTVSTFSRVDPSDNRPLRRPTTPITNLSMTGNSQYFGDKKTFKKSFAGGDEKLQGESYKAFLTKDKLSRTPPRGYDDEF
ncbi:MAG: hypothetical protein MJ252_21025 [archaeon]|nr:hypothetical protein [archaeon]